MSTGLTPQNADRTFENLTVTDHAVVGDLTTAKITASVGNFSVVNTNAINTDTINDTSAYDIITRVDAYPGDDIQTVLDNWTAHPERGYEVVLAAGSYDDTSLIIPAGITIRGIPNGAFFDNLTSLEFLGDATLENIGFTVNNSDTTSLVVLSTSCNLILSGNSEISGKQGTTLSTPIFNIPNNTNFSLVLKDLSTIKHYSASTAAPQRAITVTGTALNPTGFELTIEKNAVVYGEVNITGNGVGGNIYLNGTLSYNERTYSSSDTDDVNVALYVDPLSDVSVYFNDGFINGLTQVPYDNAGYRVATGVTRGFGQVYNPTYNQSYGGLPLTNLDVQTVSTDGAVNLTFSNFLGGILLRTGLTGNVIDVLPDPTTIATGVRNNWAGISWSCMYFNQTSHTVTINGIASSPGIGTCHVYSASPLAGNGTFIFPANSCFKLIFVVTTDFDSASPAYDVYVCGASA